MRLHSQKKNGILFFERYRFLFCRKTRKGEKLENLIMKYENDVLTARLAGELDHHLAAEIRAKIDEAMMINLPKKLKS